MNRKELICIVCPMGCHLKVSEATEGEQGYLVEGNKCPRGKEYGINEMTNPTRVLTTTVTIQNAFLKRLPVKTKGAIPKSRIYEAMRLIDKVTVTAPINIGEIIIQNILGTGIDVVASRSMK